MIKLPNYKSNEKGQILVVFLLVLVVGLALALSIASRTVTDIRQATTSDDSNRAYFAAEAGIESALKKIESDPSFRTDTAAKKAEVSPNFTDVNSSKSDVDVQPLSITAGQVFEFPNLVKKDEVVQINLIETFEDLNTRYNAATHPGSFARSDRLMIYYGRQDITYSTLPAIEVSVIVSDGTNWEIRKYAFDNDAGRRASNGFCQADTDPSGARLTNLNNSIDFKYRAEVRFNDGAFNCSGAPIGNDDIDSLPAAMQPIIARVRILYSNPELPVGVQGLNSAGSEKVLPVQGHKIESIGSTPSNVTRKLTVTRLYPALPAIFDYVLFNGSTSNPLTKP